MYKLILLSFAGVLGCLAVLAQSAGNPFDLVHRVPKEDRVVVAPRSQTNPFDVVAHLPPGSSGQVETSSRDIFRPLKKRAAGQGIGAAFLYWTLFLLLTFLSFSIAFNRKALARAWNSFLNDNALAIAQRESTGLVGSTPYYLMYASFALNAGVFLFLIAGYFWKGEYNTFLFLGVCVLTASILLLIKHLILALIGQLVPVGDTVSRYGFLIMVFNCILGLFLLPFNFLIAFFQPAQGFLIFWALGLILLFYAYRALRATAIGSRFVSNNLFHFFLYLCTVEIAPILLLLKMAMNQGNS